MFTRIVLCLFTATAIGSVLGCGLGAALVFVSWGMSVWMGAVVGTLAGCLAGILAAVDTSERFDGGGQWVGAGAGVLALAGLFAYAAAYGPGIHAPSAGDCLYLIGAGGFAGGTGFACGRVAESIGRVIMDV